MSNIIGVAGLLGVAFVVLKLMGYIYWSWWLVTLPFWVGFALELIGLVIFLGGVLVYRSKTSKEGSFRFEEKDKWGSK